MKEDKTLVEIYDLGYKYLVSVPLSAIDGLIEDGYITRGRSQGAGKEYKISRKYSDYNRDELSRLIEIEINRLDNRSKNN